MGAQMIAVFLVLLVTGGFALVALYYTAIEINARIKQKVVDELRAYDSLVQQKEDELSALKGKLSVHASPESGAVKAAKSDVGTAKACTTPEADFVNRQFFKDYGSIRRHFSADRMDIENSLWQLNAFREKKASAIIMGLTEKLHFENTYKISVLRSDEQIEVLNLILTDPEKAVLEDYRQTVDRFDCPAFFSWLCVKAKSLDPTVRVLTAEMVEEDAGVSAFAEASAAGAGGEISEWQKDSELCEGFQVRVGNRLFDFGIRKSELIL